MMSATILDVDAFCTSLGLAPKEVKFIQVPSDFPVQNRPVFPLNIAYLNSDSLQQQEVQTKISGAVENVMTLHRNHKGIILTTSYKQVNFIKENISEINKRRLLQTDPEIPRDEVITKHVNSTCEISSLHYYHGFRTSAICLISLYYNIIIIHRLDDYSRM
jgi:Rad3-related DNA helicase